MIADVIGLEGGYSNHDADRGGATRYGVTEAVARRYGYSGAMKDLPKDVAVYIYTKEYWEKIRGDDLLAVAPAVAFEVFDTAVNTGVSQAGRFLQASLNGLNDAQRLYPDVVGDGVIGSRTLAALRGYAAKRDVAVLVKLLNCLQGAFYLQLVELREMNEVFLYGWVQQRVDI